MSYNKGSRSMTRSLVLTIVLQRSAGVESCCTVGKPRIATVKIMLGKATERSFVSPLSPSRDLLVSTATKSMKSLGVKIDSFSLLAFIQLLDKSRLMGISPFQCGDLRRGSTLRQLILGIFFRLQLFDSISSSMLACDYVP